MKQILQILIVFLFLVRCTSVQLKGEIHNPTTVDNWKLTIEHFPPESGKPEKKYPVIICHGLIGNRYNFTINENDSFVAQLQQEGYDVWILDLRGRRDAGVPSLFFGEHTYDFSFDDYASKDVDTAISYVLEKTKKDKVNWIGHSMGGMVVYARLGSMNENRIANLITLGSPFSFFQPTKNIKFMHSFNWLLPGLPVVPASTIARIEANTKLPLVPRKLFLNLFYYKSNIDSEIELKLKRHGTNNEAPNVFKQFSGAMETGVVQSLDKSVNYTANLKNITIPTLLISGKRDHLGSPYIVRYVYDSISSKDKTFMSIGKSEGNTEDYGHVDLIIGREMKKDIIKPFINWLEERNKK